MTLIIALYLNRLFVPVPVTGFTVAGSCVVIVFAALHVAWSPRATSPSPFLGMQDLAKITDGELAALDMAAVNLACAAGLPGTEDLDANAAVRKLDQWAQHVRLETERHLYRYHQNPAEYDHSEPYFRALMLLVILQEDFGVHYNADRIHDVDFRDPRDLFIHGLLEGSGGTCVSLPVLYAAVGRRLGYPLKLVTTAEHVFVRWDDERSSVRFNIEGTNHGLSRHPDSYYETWPRPTTQEERAAYGYLRSLTPKQESSLYAATRGHCLLDNGDRDGALDAYRLAVVLWPESALQSEFLDRAQRFRASEEHHAKSKMRGQGVTEHVDHAVPTVDNVGQRQFGGD